MPRLIGHPVTSFELAIAGVAKPVHLAHHSGTGAHARGSGLVAKPAAAATHSSRPGPVRHVSGAAADAAAATPAAAAGAAAQGTLSERERLVLESLAAAGINDSNERAMFMGQMSVESRRFTRLVENLGYRPQRLVALFPKKFKSLADAQAVVGKGQAAIAERIYGGRRKLGNVHAGDGYRYRGRGFIQLTGRSNYRAAGKAIDVDLERWPDRAAEPDVAAKIAIWFWQTHHLAGPARHGDVEKVTRVINGGVLGLAERRAEFESWRMRLAQPGSSLPWTTRLP